MSLLRKMKKKKTTKKNKQKKKKRGKFNYCKALENFHFLFKV